MTLRVIDIESTGMDPNNDVICEVASIDIAADGTVSNRMEHLVNPGRPMPPEASAVHHLIDADFTGAQHLDVVLPLFSGADAYVAHNCAFEKGFLGKHWPTAKWVCTYKVSLRVWPDFESHSNQSLRYRLGLINPFGIDRSTLVAHRALSDAIVTAAIFFELTKLATWAQMLQWSEEPALIRTFRFGKHRGKKFSDVDADYLCWIVDKSDLDADVKFSAKYELNARAEAAA